MQDQGRRLLIAVALALGVMFMWQSLFVDDKPKPPTPLTQGSGAVVPGAAGPATTSARPTETLAPAITRGPEQTIALTFPNVEAEFSSHGGVLKRWHLTDKRYDREKQPAPGRPGRGDLVPKEGAFGIAFFNSTYGLPLEQEWQGTKVSDKEVIYTTKTDTLSIEKRFVLIPEAYVVKLTVTVKATVPAGAEARQLLAISVFGFQNPKDGGGGGQSVSPRRWESATYRRGELVGTTAGAVGKKPRFESDVKWTGFEHPFLLVGLAPKPEVGVNIDKQTFAEGTEGLMRTDILFTPMSVFKSDSGVVKREVVAYLGPKHYTQLEAADTIAAFPTGFTGTIDLGWFAFIGRPLMWLLLKFYSFLGNWGLAIVLLTICVKALTVPLVTKSMRSMKAMAVLQPQVKLIQDKYKDDKQRAQMEAMALYKQHGGNPMLGCLPLFLQMPIWLALYRMLSSTGELYNQAFIPGWLDDLTNTDPFYILPFVLMITMFLQARLTPMGPTTDPAQRMQQRMMQYGLPLMFGVMSFFFPSGLTLYIFTNTILSALHSIYMNKFDKKSIALTAKIKAAQEAAEKEKLALEAAKAKPANPPKAADGDKPRPAIKPAGGSSKKKGGGKNRKK